jgi:hypothetical protein
VTPKLAQKIYAFFHPGPAGEEGNFPETPEVMGVNSTPEGGESS